MVMRLRVRGKEGVTTVEVPDGVTMEDAAALVESVLGIPARLQLWKIGFPPQPFPRRHCLDDFAACVEGTDAAEGGVVAITTAAGEDGATVDFTDDDSAVGDESGKDGLQRGDSNVTTLPASDGRPASPPPPSGVANSIDAIAGVAASSSAQSPAPSRIDPDMVVVRRVIDADDSCLFNSVGYAVHNHSRRHAAQLRQQIADAVLGDPTTYTEAFLGQSPQQYVAFITRPGAWGGAIELSIFARLYRTEIAAFDIIRNRHDVYGQGENYPQRALVIYDGIHYDAMAAAFDEGLPEDMDVTLFSPDDDLVMRKASEVMRMQHEKKQFTDTSNFTLRCLVCQEGLVGEKGAQEHAVKTGHQNFAEFR